MHMWDFVMSWLPIVQGRERDGVGGARRRLLAESESPGRAGRQQVAVRHRRCRNARSGGSTERSDHAASSRSRQLLNIREELVQAEAHGPKTRVRL